MQGDSYASPVSVCLKRECASSPPFSFYERPANSRNSLFWFKHLLFTEMVDRLSTLAAPALAASKIQISRSSITPRRQNSIEEQSLIKANMAASMSSPVSLPPPFRPLRLAPSRSNIYATTRPGTVTPKAKRFTADYGNENGDCRGVSVDLDSVKAQLTKTPNGKSDGWVTRRTQKIIDDIDDIQMTFSEC